MLSFYNRSPFHLINDMANIPFGGDVYVISDAKYAELKQKQAADEIAVLNKRLLAYEAAADKLKETINELRIEHDLLPEATEE
jgi:hypothetical protein